MLRRAGVTGVLRDERVVGRERVGEEKSAVDGVRGRWVKEVGGEEADGQDQRVDPCVAEGKVLPAAEEASSFSTLGVRARGAGLGVSLRGRAVSGGALIAVGEEEEEEEEEEDARE